MHALANGRDKLKDKNLRSWLRHGEKGLEDLNSYRDFGDNLSRANRLSRFNVLRQIENLKSYPIVKDRLKNGKVRLHGWWFELSQADVYAYEDAIDKFVLFDDDEAARINMRLNENHP